MMNTNYNQLLFEKCQKEYDDFIANLKTLPIEKVIDKSYEKVLKEDFLSCISELNLDENNAKALYLKKYPLDFVYEEWMDNDVTLMEDLRDTLYYAGDKAHKELKTNNRSAR